MQLSPGTRIGIYEVLAPIGAGGMGEVYRARDTRLGRDIALKLLADGLADDAERRARFDREARTLASLSHPGIVTIFAVEEADGKHFIAMECVEGRPLSELIPKAGFSLDRFLTVAVQLANAVAAAHKHGIVHRDLKPANVMLGPHDRVKVLDFGLAKLCERPSNAVETALPARDITGEGRIVGTVAYMSPEQAEGRTVDERSDVFSLGVLLYEMASGERPFKGDTSLSVLSAILREAPKPLAEVNPALPRELSRYVRRCLAKDPDDRYQSATDLRTDLEDLQQSALSGELRGPTSGSPRSSASTWTSPWVLATGIALAALAGLGWMWSRSSTTATSAAAPQLSFSRLTMVEGVAQDPHVSPDGKWVVYVSAVGGTNDIYLQSTTGQTSINLTKDSPAPDSQPAFSPDGELIAFRSERDGGGLFVMGRMGESVRRLTRTGYQPAWFPDARQIVFASQLVANAESRGPGISELWLVDLAGGEPRLLFSGDAVQPRVSPNARRIAFWGMPISSDRLTFSSGNRDVWTMAADGSNAVRVTTEAATDWNPVWSPDGQWLYYLSDRRGSMNLWRIAIDEATGAPAAEPQPLTAPAPYVRHFSLAADGTVGTFATLAVASNLARAPFDSRTATVIGPVQPLTTGPRDFQLLDVSPDGREVLMQTSFRLQEDLFLATTDSPGLRNLTNDRHRDRAPHWSPDGRQVLFYSDRGGNNELWSIDRDGGALRQLTRSEGKRFYPVPSRDGSKVAASDINAWALYIYDARDFSKPLEQLPPFPQDLRSGAFVPSDWSPDGTLLTGFAGSNIWVYSFQSKTYRRVAVSTASVPSWLPDGRRILFARQGRLVVVDWISGETREIFAIPGENIGSPRVSRDGKLLYFLHGSASGDIWSVRFDIAGDSAPVPR